MSQPIRRDSYRNPNGVRAEAQRTPGRGRGTGWGREPRSVAPAREPEPDRTPPTDIDPPSAAAHQAFAAALDAVQTAVPASAFESWVEPLELLGERQDALAIAGPLRIVDWVDRRYAGLLGATVRRHGFAGVFVYELPSETPEVELQ